MVKPRKPSSTAAKAAVASAWARRPGRRPRRFTLRLLREALGKLQVEVAEAAEMNQSDVSKLEARDDAKVSTLSRYVEAIGAELEVAVVMPNGRRFILDLPPRGR